jgi:hypothetical protein
MGAPFPGGTLSAPELIGLDVQGGWFANNGSVPNGRRVAFIRTRNGEAKTISTLITGLDPGKAYRVGFRANARENGTEERAPSGPLTAAISIRSNPGHPWADRTPSG